MINEKELREEWKNFIGNQRLSNNAIADWWLSHLPKPLEEPASIGGSELHLDKLMSWLSDVYSETDRYIYGEKFPEIRSQVGQKLKELADLLAKNV